MAWVFKAQSQIMIVSITITRLARLQMTFTRMAELLVICISATLFLSRATRAGTENFLDQKLATRVYKFPRGGPDILGEESTEMHLVFQPGTEDRIITAVEFWVGHQKASTINDLEFLETRQNIDVETFIRSYPSPEEGLDLRDFELRLLGKMVEKSWRRCQRFLTSGGQTFKMRVGENTIEGGVLFYDVWQYPYELVREGKSQK